VRPAEDAGEHDERDGHSQRGADRLGAALAVPARYRTSWAAEDSPAMWGGFGLAGG
jgi:hypothetical protein